MNDGQVAKRHWLPLRHSEDPAVHDELDWARTAAGVPAGLEIEWLGTAGFRLTYEDVTVLIDPYVSRSSLGTVLRSRPLVSDPEAVDRWLPYTDAVLVGHSHFDHAVDVPALAARGSQIFGSTSVRRLLALNGLAASAIVVDPHRRYDIGPFGVTFVPSAHSKLIAGLKVPSDGELTCDSLDHLGAGSYRCGQVWGIRIEVAGIVLYHQGSANLIDDQVPSGGVDVFLCGIAGRGFTRNFVERFLAAVDPAVVIAHHHDDFFRPLDATMGFSFNVNLGRFVDDLARCAPGLPVHTMRPVETLSAP